MSLPSAANPFEASADPRGYVPRAASQAVLDRLERHVSDGAPAVLLRGPAGIGKSMLLAILHQRLAGSWQIAHVAVSPSPSMELSHRILDQLDVSPADDPSSTLVATARRSAAHGRRVLVIVDQASHAPTASSRQLARSASRAGGDLCVLFAVTEEAGAEAFGREIGAEVPLATVRFDAPMNAAETAEYIAQRIDQTIDSQALHDRFDEAALRYVIDRADGNPRQANELAYDALRRLERGESLPVEERDAQASAELDAGGPASPAEEPRLRPGAPAFDDPFHAEGSLGGGLLGAGPTREPAALDATQELFPPGFLRSRRDPWASSEAPAPGAADAASARGEVRPGAAGQAGDERDAAPAVAAASAAHREAAPPVASVAGVQTAAAHDRAGVERIEEDAAPSGSAGVTATAADAARRPAGATSEDTDAARRPAGSTSEDSDADLRLAGAMSTDADAALRLAGAVSTAADAAREGRRLERKSERRDAARPGAVVERATSVGSSRRQKLWMAALVLTAVVGGYVAGRVDPRATESPSRPVAPAEPIARVSAPTPAEPVVRVSAPTPAEPVVRVSEPTAVEPVARVSEPASPDAPPVRPDRSDLDAADRPDAMLAAAAPPRVVDAPAEPAAPRATAAPTRTVDALPPVSAQAVAPGRSPEPPRPLSATPSPPPAAERRARVTPAAADPPSVAERPAASPRATRASTVEDEPSVADAAAAAIVVEARGSAEAGERASAFVRVRVRLEAGATLTVDGERVGVAPLSDLMIEPGLHTFVAELPDGLQIEQLVRVSPDTRVVEF